MIHSFYRKVIKPLISNDVREKIQKSYLLSCYISYHNAGSIREYVKGKLIYLFPYFYSEVEHIELYSFMGKYGFCHLPYPFTLNYTPEDVMIFFDETCQLPYVLHRDKRLYFPNEGYTKYQIQFAYNELNKEQDFASPHRYISNEKELSGKTLLDIGAAEGIFALDVIEYVKNASLFECEEKWIKPLMATFAPWRKKVHIYQKMVTGRDNDNEISLSYFFEDQQLDNVFIKMDIEGGEQAVLNASLDILTNFKSIELAVCTYHLVDDMEKIESLLSSLGYQCSYTDGYFYINRQFRKAVLRAYK